MKKPPFPGALQHPRLSFPNKSESPFDEPGNHSLGLIGLLKLPAVPVGFAVGLALAHE